MKGRRGRNIPIHPRLRPLLRTLIAADDGRLFHDANGAPLKPHRALRSLTRVVISPLTAEFPTPSGEVGFEHGRLHGLRHFFVSQSFLHGATESEIKEWVGHKDSRVIELYRHLGAEESRSRMERFDLLGETGGRVVRSPIVGPIAPNA